MATDGHGPAYPCPAPEDVLDAPHAVSGRSVHGAGKVRIGTVVSEMLDSIRDANILNVQYGRVRHGPHAWKTGGGT